MIEIAEYEQQNRDRQTLAALARISLRSRGRTSPREVFEAIYTELCTLFAADACFIALCDTRFPGRFSAALIYDEGSVEYEESAPYGTNTSVIISERRPLLFVDLAAESPGGALAFGNLEKRSRAWMGVPLQLGESMLGVVSLQSYTPGLYTSADLELLQLAGDVIAVAIDNASLWREQRALSERLAEQASARTSEIDTLSSIAGEMVLQTDLAALTGQALKQAINHLRFDSGTVRLLDESGTHLLLLAQQGFGDTYSDRTRAALLATSPMRLVVAENRPTIVEIGLGQTTNRDYLRDYEAMIGVPLRIRAQVIGTFSLFSRTPRIFGAHHVNFVQALADQMAIAVANARLLTERDHQVTTLSALNAVAEAAGTTLDLRTMLTRVHTALHGTLAADAFTMVIIDPERGVVLDGITIDQGQAYEYWQAQPPPPDSLTGWIIANRAPLHFDRLLTEIAQRPDLGRYIVGAQRPAESWLGVPLIGRDGLAIGVIAVQSYTAAAFSAADRVFLESVARQVSLHVQNAALFAERERQLEANARLVVAEQAARRTADTLAEVARVLSASFERRDVLDAILRELKRVIDFDSATIMLVDRRDLRIAALYNYPEVWLSGRALPLNRRSGAGLVVQNRQPVIIDDVQQSSDWIAEFGPVAVRSWMGVPLIAKGNVLGVLNIDGHTPGRFSARDATTALAFASQAAVAIENALLYEESVTRIEQELAIAQRIQSNLFPAHIPSVAGVALAARCIPARETGGDFYDCFDLATDDGQTLALMIGDASGKGIQGAMLMAVARSVMRSEAHDHISPAAVLRETNALVTQDIPKGTFVALSYATLNIPTQTLAFSSAGQLAPLLRRADGTLSYLEPPGPRLPIGIFEGLLYEQLHVRLDPGDLVLCYTDGVVEAHSPTGTLFGFERLEALVAQVPHLAPEPLIEAILMAVREFSGVMPQQDDLTLLALQIG